MIDLQTNPYELNLEITGAKPDNYEAIRNAVCNLWNCDPALWQKGCGLPLTHKICEYGSLIRASGIQLLGEWNARQLIRVIARAIWAANQDPCSIQITMREIAPPDEFHVVYGATDYEVWGK